MIVILGQMLCVTVKNRLLYKYHDIEGIKTSVS